MMPKYPTLGAGSPSEFAVARFPIVEFEGRNVLTGGGCFSFVPTTPSERA